MRINQKSIWQGKAGLHEKYLEVNKNEELEIIMKNGERMIITKGKLKDLIVSKGVEKFKDRYSNSLYSLLYIEWKPVEEKLF